MIDDPIVEEIRKCRQEHAKKFNYDLDAIFKDLKKEEIESNRKTISRSPKPFLRATGS